MTETIRVVVIGGDLIRNALLGASDGGEHLEDGLAKVAADRFDERAIDMIFAPAQSISAALADLRDPSVQDPISHVDDRCDVVIIATTNDVRNLADLADNPDEATEILTDTLIATIDLIKKRSDAHVLICNVATFDPSTTPSSLYGLEAEPVSLRAHRVDLLLLKLSHLLGVSLIDIDRVTAEAGASSVVPAPLDLNRDGSRLVRDETVRVLDDYGFFDDRQLAPQVGNREQPS